MRFGVAPALAGRLEPFVKTCDRMAAFLEATQLAGFSLAEAMKFFGKPKGLDGKGSERFHRLSPLPATAAAEAYRRTFQNLVTP